jgi:hypothetical protein
MTDHLTIEELQAHVEAIVGKDFDAPKLLPIRIAEQLIAAMQREAKLKAGLLAASRYGTEESPCALDVLQEAYPYEYPNEVSE